MVKHEAAGTRAGRVAAATVAVPVGIYTTGYGLAVDARLTAWLLLVMLVGSAGYALVWWVVRSWAGLR